MSGVRRDHQKTSVVLGYDKIDYQSSSVAMNEHVGEAGERSDGLNNLNKECHVQFGEPGTKRDFVISSKLADPTGEMAKYRGQLNAAHRDMLLRTSATFGNDVAPYVTSTQTATQWNKEAVQETIALRNELRKLTGPRPTRGMSYDDEVEYVSESKSAFENKFRSHKPSIMAESVKNGKKVSAFSIFAVLSANTLLFGCSRRSPSDALLARPRGGRLQDEQPHRTALARGLQALRESPTASPRPKEVDSRDLLVGGHRELPSLFICYMHRYLFQNDNYRSVERHTFAIPIVANAKADCRA